ncbi:MAG: hypothetical protein O2958_11945 [Gemmatimonadetes bacterium]|nr:hypothetical protein [Gemmatimonadota bacterium]MDA1103886.1 hypothetical protein [Gemmatimonadota bacterium]
MILHFNYEELSALRAGAQTFLDREESEGGGVLAPPRDRARVEALLPRLEGDISLSTLAELQGIAAAVAAIVDCLRVEMESAVVATHAADEDAVAAYFDFAHGFTVEHRLSEMASEMEALIELMTGSQATTEAARSFRFPD